MTSVEYGVRWTADGESFVSGSYSREGALRVAASMPGGKASAGRVAVPVVRDVGVWRELRSDEQDGAQ